MYARWLWISGNVCQCPALGIDVLVFVYYSLYLIIEDLPEGCAECTISSVRSWITMLYTASLRVGVPVLILGSSQIVVDDAYEGSEYDSLRRSGEAKGDR